MRVRYVAKIDRLTSPGAVKFVNTVQYDPALDTPPFSIGPDDIERYHGERYLIEHVECAARPKSWHDPQVQPHLAGRARLLAEAS